MTLNQSFMAAVLKQYDSQGAGPELLPTVLTQACVQILGVAGAGLSITDELRVPLGASDATASRAEMLQTTLGEGPCLDATATSNPVKADEAEMARKWPMFHQALVTQTPYRGVASIPLHSSHLRRFGALDLYTTDPASLDRLPLQKVSTDIADVMTSILSDGLDPSFPDGAPMTAWAANDSLRNRMNVWKAVGIMIEHAGLSNSDALATLRAYAHAHDADLDDIANSMISRQLAPDTLLT